MIRAAAEGDRAARSGFARTYLPVMRAYLRARWKRHPLREQIDDAVQNIFVECFRDGGVVEKATPGFAGGFQAFLRGALQNVAARMERERGQQLRRGEGGEVEPEQIVADETSLARVFDRAYARRIMEEAAERQRMRARQKGAAALRRVQILRLRFDDGLPVRAIAERLGLSRTLVHREYSAARKEFRKALKEVVLFHNPAAAGQVSRECRKLLEILG